MTTKCDECTLDGNKVLGYGSEDADIVIVGEAPGAQEVRLGRPFIGRAGQALSTLLDEAGVTMEECWLTNTCQCRPPENRDPSAQEIQCCSERLAAEIEARDPKIVIALGNIPTKALFDKKVASSRGVFMDTVTGHKGICTYHPAAIFYPRKDVLLPFLQADIGKAVAFAKGKLKSTAHIPTKTTVINTQQLMSSLMAMMSQDLPNATIKDCLFYDWETTGLDPDRDTGFCLSLCWEIGKPVVIPMRLIREWKNELREVLLKYKLIGFNNLSFDALWNEKYGLPRACAFDLMLGHFCLDERTQPRNLEFLTTTLLDAPPYETQMLNKFGVDKSELTSKVPEDVIYEYAGMDADWTLRLGDYMQKELAEEPKLVNLYHKILHPAAEVFADMRRNGVWVNPETLANLSVELEKELENLEESLMKTTGNEEFNPRSHQQVQKHLWDTLKLEQPKLKGKKDRCADKDVLSVLFERYPEVDFVNYLHQHRQATTYYTRYVRDLPAFIGLDGRVRCNFHFDRSLTGRVSNSQPALNNIPRESTIRTVYSAEPGNVLVKGDYAQAEIRWAAHMAQDHRLIDFLKSGKDFHSEMAKIAYKKEDITKDERQTAKDLSFGILYLMSDKGLMAKTGLDWGEAKEVMTNYKQGMPRVMQWINKIKTQVRTQGYVESYFGRKRRFPLITDENLHELYRQAVNFPIQSSSSDMCLMAAIKLHSRLKEEYPEAKLILMVHDSLMVECPEVIGREIAEVVQEVMEGAFVETDVPFEVDVDITRAWGGETVEGI